MKINRGYGWGIILFLVCLACQNKEKDVQAFPGEYAVDEPVVLTVYFDSVLRLCGGEVLGGFKESEGKEKVLESIRELDKYKTGERDCYPLEEVNEAIEVMYAEQEYVYNHGGDSAGRGYFFRYLEQAARLCPDLSLLADLVSPDGKVGVIFREDWSIANPLYSFLLYKQGDGCGIRLIGEEGSTCIEELWQLQDERGGVYYLCSNNFLPLYFCQYLYRWEDGEIQLVCDFADFQPDLEWKNDYEEHRIVFDPRNVCWNYCCFQGDRSWPQEGSKTLYLELDGTASRFYAE